MSEAARVPETQSRSGGTPSAGGRLAAFSRFIPPYTVASPLSIALLFALPAVLGAGVSVWYHLAFIWAMFEIVSRRRRFSGDRAMWVASALLTVFCAANVLGYAVNGVGGSPARLLTLLTLLALPFTYTLTSFSRKDDVARAALAGSAVASYAAAAYAVFQFYWWGIRAEGLAGNALVFAHVATLSGSLCLAGLVIPQGLFWGRNMQGLLAGGLVCALLALILSGSRANWLAFLVAAACILLFWRQTRWRFTRRGVIIGLAAALALGAMAFKPVTTRVEALDQDWESLSVEGRYDTSLGLRIKLWQLGAGLVREHPWIGYGSPSKKQLIKNSGEDLAGLQLKFTHFHNGFLSAAVEAGGIGLAMVLALFATLAAVSFRTRREASSPAGKLGGCMLTVLVVTCCVSGSVNILLGHDILDAVFMSWVMVALFLAAGTSTAPARGSGDTVHAS